MTCLPGWSNLQSFLYSTTPQVKKEFSLQELWDSFKTVSIIGAEIILIDGSREIYLPAMSVLSLPGFTYIETSPPYTRTGIYEKLKELNLSDSLSFDCLSWFGVLWRGVNRIPSEHIDSQILVYYSFKPEEDGLLQVISVVTHKITSNWLDVYKEDGKTDSERTEYWKEKHLSLGAKAWALQADVPHQRDFDFIVNNNNTP